MTRNLRCFNLDIFDKINYTSKFNIIMACEDFFKII